MSGKALVEIETESMTCCDLEMSIDNEMRKFYFVKVVQVTDQQQRVVRLMAIQADRFDKWIKPLKMNSDVCYIDTALEQIK